MAEAFEYKEGEVMKSDEIAPETRVLLLELLDDIWEGITTIYPEYRDRDDDFPAFEITTTKTEDCAACYSPPLPDDIHCPVIRLNPKCTAEEVAGPCLAHELTHHLQYLRGEGGYGSTGIWRQFDPHEEEADAMAVALFWDFAPGEGWRELQTKQEKYEKQEGPEHWDFNTEWLRNLHEDAKATRMLWERIEKALAEFVEWMENQRPPEVEEWAQKRKEERARALAEWRKKYGSAESTEQEKK